MTAADRLRALAAAATSDDGCFISYDADDEAYVVYERLGAIGCDEIARVVEHDHARLIVLAPELALLAADMADALAKHGSAMPNGQYVNHAEADALLSRFEALTQPGGRGMTTA